MIGTTGDYLYYLSVLYINIFCRVICVFPCIAVELVNSFSSCHCLVEYIKLHFSLFWSFLSLYLASSGYRPPVVIRLERYELLVLNLESGARI